MESVCTDAPTVPGYTRVEVGAETACAQDASGILTCWGYPPVVGTPPAGSVLDYAIEANYNSAILPDGSLYNWGEGNLWGDDRPPEGVVFTDISVGRRHACGLDDQGNAHCWGDTINLTPFPPAPAGTYAQVATFNTVSCFIDLGGLVTCQSGIWEESFQTEWIDQIPALPFAQISLGEWIGCGVTTTGEAYCWGGDPSDLPWLDVPELH
jgi:hypothetical protein